MICTSKCTIFQGLHQYLTYIREVFIIFNNNFPKDFTQALYRKGGNNTVKMAEIKSAIELAMEKTKNLVIDPREREAMAMKEIEDRVKAVLRRHTEGMIDHDDAAKELGTIPAENTLKRAIIVDNLVEEFDVHKDNDRLFAFFHAIGIDLPRSIRDEFEVLNRNFREEVSSRKNIILKEIMDVLSGLHITGSAIEPNLDAWDEWQEEIRRTSNIFEKRIDAIKDKVKATSKSE